MSSIDAIYGMIGNQTSYYNTLSESSSGSAIQTLLGGTTTSQQAKTPLSGLKEYINNNIEDSETAGKLMAQLASVEVLMRMNDPEAYSYDQTIAFFADNQTSLSGLPTGTLLNQLV